jgi:hypothetical protein
VGRNNSSPQRHREKREREKKKRGKEAKRQRKEYDSAGFILAQQV